MVHFLSIRRGYKRAIVASAHKLLRIVYAVLRDMKPYYYEGTGLRGFDSCTQRASVDSHAEKARFGV